ncbi:MAG: baseplate J/gp47 family protein [Bacteroidales bacterium]|nr:baseplate J/gp47 family protein [Bacteroidales bacterium]
MSLFNVTPAGVITIDTSDIKTELEETVYKPAFGADINLDASTAIGQLITNDMRMATTAVEQIVTVANNGNLYYATGTALDTAAAFYGYYRKSGVGTVVVATVSGTAGTIIPEGSIASDGTYEYISLNKAIISQAGTVRVQFQCTTTGAIACPAGALNTIVSEIQGWDTITNQYAGAVGYASESDNEFRSRVLANFLNRRGRSTMGALIDNIAALDGVISVVGRENPTNQTQTIDGIEMPAHSIYVAIMGGTGTDIATVMTQQKTMGASTVGNTDVVVLDPTINYNYVYKIERPAVVPIYVDVLYATTPYTPANIAETATELLTTYVSNNPFKIGQTITGNDLAAAFSTLNMINILAIRVGTSASPTDTYATIGIDQVAALPAQNITFTEQQ